MENHIVNKGDNMLHDREKIPNFNSFSCLLDRIIIEQIKKTIFKTKQEEENTSYKIAIATQDKALAELKEVFVNFNLKAWLNSEYTYISEERTFK